jgi:rhodanese-related sulfurtransferase
MKLSQSLLPVVCLTLLMTGLAGATDDEVSEDTPLSITGAKTVDAEQVIQLIGTVPNLVIIDARHSADYMSGAIEGAINILDTDLTPEKLGNLAPGKDTPLLIYCNGLKCGRAFKAVLKAVSWGYSSVYYYARGMDEWRAKGLPLVKRQ